MRKFIGYLFFSLWMLPMLLVAAATDATTWVAKIWRRWRLCALLVIGYTGCSAQPTLVSPADALQWGNGLNELEYVGTADTLWGFAVVLVTFDPERYTTTKDQGGVVYGIQPYPAYALRWQKGFGDAEFYYLSGVRIPAEKVFLFKITTIPKD